MKRILVLILTFIYTLKGVAQETAPLTMPVSPSFSILNFEPSAVMRPTNAKSMASDILNSFDKNGKLLMNLGIEVAPYWLTSHPNLNHETYLRPNFQQTLLQSLSLSAATVKDSSSGHNKLGAGLRVKLYNGKPVNEYRIASDKLKTKTMVVNAINSTKMLAGMGTIQNKKAAIEQLESALSVDNMDKSIIDNVKAEAETIAAHYSDTPSDVNAFLEELINERVAAYQKLADYTSELLYVRQGFIIELAAASGFNTTSPKTFERAGCWANVSYATSSEEMFTFTARYMFRNNDSSLTNFDAGLGFLKKTDTYNISVEAMARFYSAGIPDTNINHQPIKRLEKNFTYRLAAQASYMVSKGISVNLSLGKDFNSPFITSSGFFSILGLNYSIFGKKANAEEAN